MKKYLLAILLFASCVSERKAEQVKAPVKSIPWCGETMTFTFHDGNEVYEPVRLVHSDSVVKELDKLRKQMMDTSVTKSKH